MSFTDLIIVAVAALVGWGIVSGIIAVVRQQRSPPYQPDATPVRNEDAAEAPLRLSVAELGERWPEILGVAKGAAPEEIDQAFRARLAECEQILGSSAAGSAERAAAETRRAQLTAAFEFIQPAAQSR